MTKKGIVFDMDGTLWDSAANVAISWNEAMEEIGYKRDPLTEADIKSVMGLTMDVISMRLFPGLDDESRAKLRSLCEKRENEYLAQHGGVLYPDLEDTMKGLKEKGYHVYIVSNCQAGYIESFLEHYKFNDLFEDIECYGNNFKKKDYNIKLLCERNHLDKAFYVGDIQGDYEATMKAGYGFIHAAYGFGTMNQPTPKINSLKELLDVIDELF